MPLINREIKTINSHVIKVMFITNSSKNNVAIIIINYVIDCEWLPKKGKKEKRRRKESALKSIVAVLEFWIYKRWEC